jgi:transposase-like protein
MEVQSHIDSEENGMQLKTILNQLEKQPGFVYTTVRLAQKLGKIVLEIGLRPRAHSRPLCSGCGRRRPRL